MGKKEDRKKGNKELLKKKNNGKGTRSAIRRTTLKLVPGKSFVQVV